MKTKPYKQSFIELVSAPSTYFLYPSAYAIAYCLSSFIFGTHSLIWIITNFTFFSGMLLFVQVVVISHIQGRGN